MVVEDERRWRAGAAETYQFVERPGGRNEAPLELNPCRPTILAVNDQPGFRFNALNPPEGQGIDFQNPPVLASDLLPFVDQDRDIMGVRRAGKLVHTFQAVVLQG